MIRLRFILATIAMACCLSGSAKAQHPPGIGYMYPVGGTAGETTEVILGGYDWTPDMQVFVHDPRIRLELTGTPGPVIVPEPPYWFSKKARRGPFPLPRETKARLTIPADVEPGIVKWQAANANGATASGQFVVGKETVLVEESARKEPQLIAALPARISGQIKHIKEVDRFQFTATANGPVSCATLARGIGSALNAVIEVRNSKNRIVAEAADTAGTDTALTFAATAGETYIVSVYDLDFRGNRSYTYQLTMTSGPRVVAAIPSVGQRGEKRPVKFVGYGIATGSAKLESVTHEVTFPADAAADAFTWNLKTDFGTCPYVLRVSDVPQTDEATTQLTLPAGVTGVFSERFGEDRYRATGAKGDVWDISVSSERLQSPIDAVVAVFNEEGKELARNDDTPGSTDAVLQFKVPADGDYQISVADASSNSGTPAATYHLSVQPAEPDFQFTVPELLNAPIGGKAKLSIKVARTGGYQDPIAVLLTGLPAGVSAPEKLEVPAKSNALNVELTVAADSAATGALINVVAKAVIGEKTVERTVGPVLLATTIKPPFTIDAEGKDDVTKWPRGTTFPAPVLITRDEGFEKDIMLEMTSRQGRHRQGINGPELIVKPNVTRILYPVFLPEWLETTRTSRMVVNGVAEVADPQGNIRYSVSKQQTRMGFLPTGALLKVSADEDEFEVRPGQTISVPVAIDRSKQLTEPITLEIVGQQPDEEAFATKPLTVNADTGHAVMSISVPKQISGGSEHLLKIRATLLKDDQLPVVSETEILVAIGTD